MRILVTRYRKNGVGWYVANRLKAMGHTVDMLEADITGGLSHLDLSGYDRVLNVAGVTLNQSVLDMDMGDTTKVLFVNLAGAMELTSEYVRQRGEDGAVFHISSIGSRKVMTNCSAYCASKAGLSHYCACASWELKDKNLPIISINPANIVGTKLTSDVQEGMRVNRGISQETIDNIYKDALQAQDLGNYLAEFITRPVSELKMHAGESIFLSNSDHR